MKVLSYGAAAILAAMVFFAPTMPPHQPSKTAVASTTPMPALRCATFVDMTKSRSEARITASLDDFTPLFDRLRMSGGEIAVGFIRDDSDHPLVRLYVPAPPEPPAVPAPSTTGGNIFINATAKRRDDAERKKYDAKRRAWLSDANARINVFIAAMTPLLDAPAHAGWTDITDAVERGDLMLAEPTEFAHPTTAILLITDGYHNATPNTVPTMRSSARVVVNGVGSLGVLAKLSPMPLRFESTAAATRYLADLGGAHGN